MSYGFFVADSTWKSLMILSGLLMVFLTDWAVNGDDRREAGIGRVLPD